jgi:hypothetical protein
MALDGASWVRGGLVETALAARGLACDRIGAVRCSLPRVMLPLGARLGLRSLAAAGLHRLELGTVLQHGEHDDGKSARKRNPSAQSASRII